MTHDLNQRELARFMRSFTRPTDGCWVWTATIRNPTEVL